MLSPIENYFAEKKEPIKGCLLFLRQYITAFDKGISEHWKYGMPMYYLDGKMFCYLWIHKKHKLPYIGFAEGRKLDHPLLLKEKRARMKILLINPDKDIDVKTIRLLLKQSVDIYQKNGHS